MILGTYFLSMRNELDASGTTYQVLQIVGALSIASVCWIKRTWQPLALNLVWAAFALYALFGPEA